ncbi:MAG: hypothetical protein AMJ88_08245 [Anaerolineae bacterium SM23_ 63]|nr:MAG: hypothetical protein AMJ88_08245 [Anaerolineae bacterium SM23_ 63]HEY46715.1 hypothetical protein [Anaerolineae bacterium]
MVDHRDIAGVVDRQKELVLSKPNVIGVGVGLREIRGRITDEMCVVALVRQKIPKAGLTPESLVPTKLEGVSTDVMQVGTLRALAGRTERQRPVPGGVSVGHYKVTAGTLGGIVRDRSSGVRLILSNNHVLANSNDARPGDPILQPGPADGGRVARDMIAELERFKPIQFSTGPATCGWAQGYAKIGNVAGKLLKSKHRIEAFQSDPEASNRIDAALARPLDGVEILDEILEIGVVGGVTPASLGLNVRKSGRTTGLTTGQIIVLEATVNIQYGDRTARFEGQIVTGPMSEPGDSGSLLVIGDSLLAVGLLFAGSTQATVYNPIQEVLNGLEAVI